MRGCSWVSRLLVAACVLSSGTVFSADTAEIETRLKDSAKYLASDELEGRGVGTKGIDAAAKYVRDQFAAAGLDVTKVNGDAFQKFELVTGSELGEKNSLRFVGADGKAIEVPIGKDAQVCSFGGSGTFDADVVFCGYGIDDPQSKYNDFEGIDVKGKVVIFLRRTPGQSDPHSPFNGGHGLSRHAELRTKISQAVQHEAAAVILVNDPYSVRKKGEDRKSSIAKAESEIAGLADAFLSEDDSSPKKIAESRQKLAAAVTRWKTLRDVKDASSDDELMPFGYAGHGDGKVSLPTFHITHEQCNALLKAGLNKSLTELEAAIDADLKPKSAVIPGLKAQGQTTVIQVRSEVANVIGVLEGSGPHADETLVIGAHYDHVGRGGANSLAPGSKDVHNGADDNASGTAALLEVARQITARGVKPQHRLVFIAFTGEELGLLGSARYVKEPVFPLDKTIAMFNMDMVGRLQDDKLTIFGSKTCPRWEPELTRLNETSKFQLVFKPEGFGPSDHSSFYGKKIPVLHFFTGTHPDYHRPSDDWEKLNIPGMRRVIELLGEMIVLTDMNPERPEYVEVKQTASVPRDGSRPYVGTIPDFGSDEEGYSISGAAPDSPAAKGGLLGGDRIVNLGGNKVTGLDDFDLALRKFKPGDEVTFVVVRGGKEVTLKVTLAAPR